MLPVSFPEQNFTFTKPEGWTDEQCSDLNVWKGHDTNQQPRIISAWKPSKEDLDALNNGGVIYLDIVSSGQPPVSLYTENPFITNQVSNNGTESRN